MLPDRLKIIYNLLEHQYTPDETIDVCDYKVKNYFHMYKESIENIMELSNNLNYTCRGIYICPFDLRYKPKLYNFDESSVINVVRKSKDITEFKSMEGGAVGTVGTDGAVATVVTTVATIEPVATDKPSVLNNEEKMLYIVKTNEPDIYNVYDNEDVLNKPSIGIALVQTLSDSKLLRDSFRDKNAITNIKFVCVFVEKFKKWRAVRQVS
jgi:hypothetical protein